MFECFVFLMLLISLATFRMISKSKEQNMKAVPSRGFMFFKEDDSDIKIVGNDDCPKEDNDVIDDAHELEFLKKNGYVDNANDFGSALAKEFFEADRSCPFKADSEETEKIKAQRRILLAFTAVNSVEENLKNNILRDIVTSAFYNNLNKKIPGFYKELNKSGAFSFYVLATRRDTDVEKYIGETFAMLCEKEKDPIYTNFGTTLYLKFFNQIKEISSNYNLKS